MFTFNRKFFLLTIFLFIIELLIALYVRDSFVRPYLGDFLVVILLCCAVRTVLNAAVWKVALSVLLFAYLIETLQYFQLLSKLGLQNNGLAKMVMGYAFEWGDVIAYTLGIVAVLVFEKKKEFANKKMAIVD